MAAPKGNRFWEARSTHGRKPIFSNPDDMWDACIQYFEWVEDNPLMETKAFHASGIITKTEIPKMRAMTIEGLCMFLGIGFSTWDDYRKREDFSEVATRAESVIKRQKFEGAAADMLNPNIIARDLGLVEKKEHSGDPERPVAVQTITRRIVDPE